MNGKGDKDSRVKDRAKYRKEFDRIFKHSKKRIKPATNPPIAPLKNNKINP